MVDAFYFTEMHITADTQITHWQQK